MNCGSKSIAHLLLALPDSVSDSELVIALQGEGFHVTRTVTGEEAVQKITEDSGISLLIIDSNLPDLNGYETVQLLRSSGFKNLIIIILAWFNLQSLATANLVGCDELIAKPLDISGLVETAKKRAMDKEQPSPIKE